MEYPGKLPHMLEYLMLSFLQSFGSYKPGWSSVLPFELPSSYIDFSTQWEEVTSMLEKLELYKVVTKGEHLHFGANPANPYSTHDVAEVSKEYSSTFQSFYSFYRQTTLT